MLQWFADKTIPGKLEHIESGNPNAQGDIDGNGVLYLLQGIFSCCMV